MEYIFSHLKVSSILIYTLLGMLICYLWSCSKKLGEIHAEKIVKQLPENMQCLVQIGFHLLRYLLIFVSVFLAVAFANHLFPPPSMWGG